MSSNESEEPFGTGREDSRPDGNGHNRTSPQGTGHSQRSHHGGAGDSSELLEAVVIQALPGELFRLRLENGKEITAHVGGKLRMGFTRLVANTKVSIELSPFDPTKARIVARIEPRER